ncbi:MAG: hypothetical protein QW478_01765 [Candidatus Micrarchaeaceae archaeon]
MENIWSDDCGVVQPLTNAFKCFNLDLDVEDKYNLLLSLFFVSLNCLVYKERFIHTIKKIIKRDKITINILKKILKFLSDIVQNPGFNLDVIFIKEEMQSYKQNINAKNVYLIKPTDSESESLLEIHYIDKNNNYKIVNIGALYEKDKIYFITNNKRCLNINQCLDEIFKHRA